MLLITEFLIIGFNGLEKMRMTLNLVFFITWRLNVKSYSKAVTTSRVVAAQPEILEHIPDQCVSVG